MPIETFCIFPLFFKSTKPCIKPSSAHACSHAPSNESGSCILKVCMSKFTFECTQNNENMETITITPDKFEVEPG